MTASTIGIDLASQARNTALCAIAWEPDRARVTALLKGVAGDGVTPLGDAFLVAAMRGLVDGLPAPAKVAIDAPLGWPVDFVRGVGDLAQWPVSIDAERRRLERRATDLWVHEVTGKLPLSVTTDRIGYAAMRAAGILAHCATVFGETVDRSGMTGLVCEAYPDPAIRCLGIWPQDARVRESYKGDATDLRKRILGRLTHAAPWLELSALQTQACVDSDDCLDALVCALVAHACGRGLTVPPPEELLREARGEGWIHLPQPGALDGLL
jgi:hypothetical protein